MGSLVGATVGAFVGACLSGAVAYLSFRAWYEWRFNEVLAETDRMHKAHARAFQEMLDRATNHDAARRKAAN